jgi:hypothetical protein
MQAALRDYSVNPQSPEALICQRTLLMCHELIFGDLPPPETTPYPSLAPGFRPLFARKKVKPHATPALVGLGMLLAAAPGLPALANVMGPVAVEQGRADALGTDLRSLQRADDDVAHSASATPVSTTLELEDDEFDDDGNSDSASDEPLHDERTPVGGTLADTSTPVPGSDDRPRRLARRMTIFGAARTSPALPLHLKKDRRKPRFSDDPLGQLDQDAPGANTQSTPQLPSARAARASGSLNDAEAALARYGDDAQRELLRRHFCRSEVGVFECARACPSE